MESEPVTFRRPIELSLAGKVGSVQGTPSFLWCLEIFSKRCPLNGSTFIFKYEKSLWNWARCCKYQVMRSAFKPRHNSTTITKAQWPWFCKTIKRQQRGGEETNCFSTKCYYHIPPGFLRKAPICRRVFWCEFFCLFLLWIDLISNSWPNFQFTPISTILNKFHNW